MRTALIHRQKGLTSVEFSIVAVAMFIVLFGALEMGRALFVMNLLSEATRRAVRVAAVCPINDPAIVRAATLADAPGGAPLDRLGGDLISVVYLDRNGNTLADPAGSFGQIRYVRVSITGYVHDMIVPLLNLSFASPDFAATLPRESLGIPREGAIVPC
jgi:hypothetical protein